MKRCHGRPACQESVEHEVGGRWYCWKHEPEAQIVRTETKELKRLQAGINRARNKAGGMEAARDALIRNSTLRPVDISRATGLTPGRVSQIQSAHNPSDDVSTL